MRFNCGFAGYNIRVKLLLISFENKMHTFDAVWLTCMELIYSLDTCVWYCKACKVGGSYQSPSGGMGRWAGEEDEYVNYNVSHSKVSSTIIIVKLRIILFVEFSLCPCLCLQCCRSSQIA